MIYTGIKKGLFFLFLAALAAHGSIAAAADLKVGVVSFQTLFKESKAGKSLEQEIKNHDQKYAADIKKQGDALTQEQQELSKKQAALSPDAFKKVYEDFQKKAKSYEEDVAAKRQSIVGASQKGEEQIVEAIHRAAADYGKKEKYSLILPAEQAVFFASEDVADITQGVLAVLDQQLPRVEKIF